MTFHWINCCWLLLLPVLFAALELRKRRTRSVAHPKILRADAGRRSLYLSTKEGLPAKSPIKVRWRLWLGLAFAILALARPQWGRLEEPVFDQSREIVIALDLSRSMLAPDVKPSRLDRAKLLISSLLERLAGERIGLIVFSGTAFLQCPLSSDYEILREFLPALNPNYLPQGGSNYTALLSTALDAFNAANSADRYLVVLSDGEATDETWRQHLNNLKTRNIRVIGLGVGTATGAMIPDGSGGFVKDERGAVVMSKLENSTLQELAAVTNGLYADASSWVDLAQILQSTIDAGRKGEFKELSRIRLAERFQWVLAPAFILFLWSFWREFPARPRPRDIHLEGQKAAPETPVAASAVLSTAATALLLGLFLVSAAKPVAAAEDTIAQPLSKLVAQLSARPTLAARDCSELAKTTLTYALRLQSAKQPVPEGPIRDGLAAVDQGQALDSKAADWDQLREELEKFLQKPEPPPEQDPQKDKSKKNDQSSDKNESEKSDPSDSDKKDQDQSEKDQKSSDQKDESQQQDPEQSKLGDMSKPEPAEPQPIDPADVQQVGGTPEKKPDAQAEDPTLLLPLQKLDQVRNQDSPARLYQIMQGNKPTPKTKGKDW